MKCPVCGSETDGAFCAECGAPQEGAKCRACGSPLLPGANYCTQCGTAVREAPRTNPIWYAVGGVLILAILATVLLPAIRESKNGRGTDDRAPISQFEAPVEAAAAQQTAAPPPLSDNPRENADRLFNRIMQETVNGDTARAKFFLPMALQSYEAVGALDADGLYHLGLLQNLDGDYRAARATAEKILASAPHHILGLSIAASAARESGDVAAARKYYEKLLAGFEIESKVDRPEYRDHARLLPEIRAEAQAFLQQK